MHLNSSQRSKPELSQQIELHAISEPCYLLSRHSEHCSMAAQKKKRPIEAGVSNEFSL